MATKFKIAFFGSSLVSSYWNGAATYYRGIIRALARRGHRVTFFEPDAFDRQAHRDMADPPWARVIVFPPTEQGADCSLRAAADHDILIKASGVGVLDTWLEREVLAARKPGRQAALFWDVDAPATLQRLQTSPHDPFHGLIPQYDLILTYGGGARVIREYEARGARQCVPIYNAVDSDTHFPTKPDARFEGTLSFLGNRLPDREARVREYFFNPAARLPQHTFVLGGNGWEQNVPRAANLRHVGHVFSQQHNAFNCTPLAVLNINRQSMASYGYSPATRIFEAAGAGACIISDRWPGIDTFLEPGSEILLADGGDDVAEHLARLDRKTSQAIGTRARRHVLAEHTYRYRAQQFEEVLHNHYSKSPSVH